jgi:predicted Zn-dependent peptidase
MTPASLRAAHDKWLRPDLARITVVGDITMAELLPMLESAFGKWQVPASPPPAKDLTGTVPSTRTRIVLIDRPNSPQSVIVGGRVLPVTGRDQNLEALDLANEVLGGGFLSRINTNLREERGWSYGASTGVTMPAGSRALLVIAPVQADRTGDSIREILSDMKAFPGKKPVNAEELNRVTDGNIRGLPNRFETNQQVLGAIMQNDRLGRPDTYYATLPGLYRSIDATALDNAASRFLQPEGIVFVVVGDRKTLEPQLKALGLPIEIADAAGDGD